MHAPATSSVARRTRLVVAALVGLLALPATALAAPLDTAASARDVAVTPRAAQRYAVVTRPYGAAIRTAPDSEAPIVHSSICGDVWRVLEVRDGWVRITNGVGDGWIGGSRVALVSAPASADCAEARDLGVGQLVRTYVATGCLSLRAAPSRTAAMRTCVANGHRYVIVNGPVDPGSGEDWFEVYSDATGSGWVLADHLYAG